MAPKGKTRKVRRSAVTGRFVSEKCIKRHPKTTVTESIKIRKKK